MPNAVLKRALLLALAAILIPWAIAPAHAAIIPIANGNFETGPYMSPNVVSSWIIDHAYTWVEYLPSGSYFALLNAQDNNPLMGQGAIHQILNDDWEIGTYELSFDVINRFGYEGYNGGIVAQLKAGPTVLGSTTFTPAPVSGGFDYALHTLSFSVSLDGASSAIGLPIGIYFTHTGAGGAYIDNVSLTLAEVPEPSSITLAIVVLGAILLTTRRR